MEDKAEQVSLMNIGGGAAVELFDHELLKAVRNIRDINTDAKAKRKIALEVVLTPYPDRTGVDISIACTSKLAALNKVTGGSMFILQSEGEFAAYSHDLRQQQLFPAQEEKPATTNVVPMQQQQAAK